jgi:hypothetical protein
MDDVERWLKDLDQSKKLIMAQVYGRASLTNRYNRIDSGDLSTAPCPWPRLAGGAKLNLPQTVNVLCGDPGAAKSFFTLQLFRHMQASGAKVALLSLEGTRDWYQQRILTQLSGDPACMDMDAVARNPGHYRELIEDHGDAIDAFDACLHFPPKIAMTLQEMLDWCREQLLAGVRVIGIDPVTATVPSKEPWIDDFRLITELKSMASNYSAAFWIVTHPKKGRGAEIGLDVLAGGTAYARFTDMVLWLVRNSDDDRFILDDGTTSEVVADRCIVVCKTRDGNKPNAEMAMVFNKHRMTFDEMNWVRVRKKVKKDAGAQDKIRNHGRQLLEDDSDD